MKDLKNRLTSRKLWLTLGGVIGFVLLGITGQSEWKDVVDKISYLILAYVGMEGTSDAIRTWKK